MLDTGGSPMRSHPQSTKDYVGLEMSLGDWRLTEMGLIHRSDCAFGLALPCAGDHRSNSKFV